MSYFINTVYFICLLCCFILGISQSNAEKNQIPSLKNFDFISGYDTVDTRQKRDLNDDWVYIKFKSLNRDFKLRLTKSKSLFDHDSIELNNRTVQIDDKLYTFYSGSLVDDTTSYVSGTIIDGIFYGTIRTNTDNFFIESIRKFHNFLLQNNTEVDASISNNPHTIIYNEDDVIFNSRHNRTKRSAAVTTDGEFNNCGSEDVMKWMSDLQKKAYDTNVNENFYSFYSPADQDSVNSGGGVDDVDGNFSLDTAKERYSKNSNQRLSKRNAQPSRLFFPNNKTVCNLYLKIDPIMYKEIYRNEGNFNRDLTLKFLMNFMQKHVEALNIIYSGLQFFNSDKTGYYVGVKFVIKRTKIITDDMCTKENVVKLTEADQKLCEQFLDVQTFLGYVALDDFTQFCLGYTFTARDFADGTLGLAWVAKPSGNVGGLCEKRQSVAGVQKSLNSGIVTLINYQSRVAEAVSQITFAHEVGHNFGAEHDPEGTCSPGEKNGGNFIMYRKATTGTQRNNRNFSQCSKESMGSVMVSLVSNTGKFCLDVSNGTTCGNMIVEPGEECDCGYGTECKESCCYAADTAPNNRCKLKPNKICSPSAGPCCKDDCTFTPNGTLCLKGTECLNDVVCNGQASFCPKNDSKYFIDFDTDGKIKDCNDGTQVCRSGACAGSICEKYNMVQCYLEGDLKNKDVDKETLCHLACQGPATNNSCTDSFKINILRDPKRNSSGFILKPGSACSGTQGYCDIFSKCRAVDAEGPLLRLKKLLLNPQTLSDIKTWVTEYWWAVVLIVIGVLVFMGVFVKVCSVHTPSSNPRKPAALKFSETLRRPMRRHHQSKPVTHLSNPNVKMTDLRVVRPNPLLPQQTTSQAIQPSAPPLPKSRSSMNALKQSKPGRNSKDEGKY